MYANLPPALESVPIACLYAMAKEPLDFKEFEHVLEWRAAGARLGCETHA